MPFLFHTLYLISLSLLLLQLASLFRLAEHVQVAASLMQPRAHVL